MRKVQRKQIMLAIFPALMVPVLMPLLAHRHLPDFALGALVGVLIGLSLVGLAVAVRRSKGCP